MRIVMISQNSSLLNTSRDMWEDRWLFHRNDRNIFCLSLLNMANHKSQLVNHHPGFHCRTEIHLAIIKAAVYEASLRVGGSYFSLGVHRQWPTSKKSPQRLKSIILMIKRNKKRKQNKLVLSQTDREGYWKVLFFYFIISKCLYLHILF